MLLNRNENEKKYRYYGKFDIGVSSWVYRISESLHKNQEYSKEIIFCKKSNDEVAKIGHFPS